MSAGLPLSRMTKRVNLDDNRLSKRGFISFVSNLDPYVMELVLSNNNIGDDGIRALTRWIQNSKYVFYI